VPDPQLAVFEAAIADRWIIQGEVGRGSRATVYRARDVASGETITIARQVADALGHAHAEGALHKDVKPENIFLSGSRVLLMDLGVARAITRSMEETMTGDGLTLGSRGYMSPEHARGRRRDRCPGRPVQSRMHLLRDAHGRAAVHGRHATDRAAEDGVRDAGSDHNDSRHAAADRGCGGRPPAGEGAVGALSRRGASGRCVVDARIALPDGARLTRGGSYGVASRRMPIVRKFASDEWRLYRMLRLAALEESPDAFGSTVAHERPG